MGTKVKETCTVLSQECIGKDIYSMWIQTKTIAGNARPGQFVSVYTQDGSKLLPRPISLCEIDKEKGALRLVYRVTGPKTGTESFSRLHAGAQLELLGPLGNGFPLEEAAGRKVFLMGGGIGVPPMLETMKQLDAKKIAVLGYRDELFLNEEFEKNGDSEQKSHFICCPLLAVGAMKKISSHKIVFLKYWGAKIDILEKKKLHKQQLLEKS